MNVTYVCNNHCTFCAVGTRTQFDGHPTRQREHLVKYRARGRHDGRLRRRRADAEPRARPARPLRAPHRLRAHQRHHQRAPLRSTPTSRGELVRSGLTTLALQRPRPRRADARAAGRASPRRSSRPSRGIRNCVRLAPAGVELGMNITLTKGNYEKLAEVAELALSARPALAQHPVPHAVRPRDGSVAPDTAGRRRRRDAGHRRLPRPDEVPDHQPALLLHARLRALHDGRPAQARAAHGLREQRDGEPRRATSPSAATRKPVCEPCPHAVFCGGFYELDDVPEPPWLIAPEDLLRPVRAP